MLNLELLSQRYVCLWGLITTGLYLLKCDAYIKRNANFYSDISRMGQLIFTPWKECSGNLNFLNECAWKLIMWSQGKLEALEKTASNGTHRQTVTQTDGHCNSKTESAQCADSVSTVLFDVCSCNITFKDKNQNTLWFVGRNIYILKQITSRHWTFLLFVLWGNFWPPYRNSV